MSGNTEYLSQMFKDTVELAEEEGACNSKEHFIEFILQYIPEDILEALLDIIGGSDDGTAHTFLGDYWSDNYDEIMMTRISSEEKEDIFDPQMCSICERNAKLTHHHLYPRETHKKMIKRGYEKEVLQKTVTICRLCHSTIHRFFTNDELSASYNTLQLLMENEKMQRYSKWASSQSDRRVFKSR